MLGPGRPYLPAYCACCCAYPMSTCSLSRVSSPSLNYHGEIEGREGRGGRATQDLLLKHPDKIFATYIWNRWNTWNIHLKHTCIVITTCATARSTFKTSRWNICNLRLKHMKYLKRRLATCVFCHYNIYNILDLLLQHSDKTLEIKVWNAWNSWNTALDWRGG
jgi:hypothetical protein